MPTNGYKQDLQTRLKDYINQQTHDNADPVVVYVQNPTVIESFRDGDTLFLTYNDQHMKEITCAMISQTGFSIETTILYSVNCPVGTSYVMSLARFGNNIAISTSGQNKGIHLYVKQHNQL